MSSEELERADNDSPWKEILEFWQEFKQFEQERTMTYITTGERIGYERGREEGKQEGKQEGEQTLILRQLQRRVGELPQQVREQIQTLGLEQLEALGEALLDFTAIEDLLNWLEANITAAKLPDGDRARI